MATQYLTTTEVAELCRTSPDTVRYWRHTGKGPRSFKVGRRLLYQRTDVDQWLAQLRDEESTR
jgi:excisionase family DNA binding protein